MARAKVLATNLPVREKDVLHPEEIKFELNQLIQEAQSVDPQLASRLEEISRWIAHKKSGLLMRKRHLMQLLAELVADATFWLALYSLPAEDRETQLAQLSPVERYWYEYLFPAWLNQPDPKLSIWKKKLMADEFSKNDAALIGRICQAIETGGGDTINPYIVDLSMATDLIASGLNKLALCVQLTTVRDSLSTEKQLDWESTLKYWGIRRGLFLSFNPNLNQVHSRVGKRVLEYSERLPQQCYRRHSIE